MNYFCFVHLFHSKYLVIFFIFNFPNLTKPTLSDRVQNIKANFVYFIRFWLIVFVIFPFLFVLIFRHNLEICIIGFFSPSSQGVRRIWYFLGHSHSHAVGRDGLRIHGQCRWNQIRLSSLSIGHAIALASLMQFALSRGCHFLGGDILGIGVIKFDCILLILLVRVYKSI